MSYGIAPRFFASDATSFAGTKMSSGWGSMKREISHGHAMRSTRARSRVIHFMVVVLLESRSEANGGDETSPHDAQHGATGHHLERRHAPQQQRRHGADEDHGGKRIHDGVRREPDQRDREHADDARHHPLQRRLHP